MYDVHGPGVGGMHTHLVRGRVFLQLSLYFVVVVVAPACFHWLPRSRERTKGLVAGDTAVWVCDSRKTPGPRPPCRAVYTRPTTQDNPPPPANPPTIRVLRIRVPSSHPTTLPLWRIFFFLAFFVV